jgi:septum site-determining protein MinC
MSMSVVSFKGTREGLIITLGEKPWRDVMNDLAAQLGRPGAQSFFQGARVLLETGQRSIDVHELEELIALFSQHGMSLTSVSGAARTQEAFDQVRAALAPRPAPASPAAPIRAPVGISIEEKKLSTAALPIIDETRSLLVMRTVRSGQRLEYAGTIVIIGDVNPGAMVAAEGNVIVWGKVRGVVHAGTKDDPDAVVGALILQPTQLRIGKYIARAPDDKRTRNWPAEVARVRDGRIVLEPWSG